MRGPNTYDSYDPGRPWCQAQCSPVLGLRLVAAAARRGLVVQGGYSICIAANVHVNADSSCVSVVALYCVEVRQVSFDHAVGDYTCPLYSTSKLAQAS